MSDGILPHAIDYARAAGSAYASLLSLRDYWMGDERVSRERCNEILNEMIERMQTQYPTVFKKEQQSEAA